MTRSARLSVGWSISFYFHASIGALVINNRHHNHLKILGSCVIRKRESTVEWLAMDNVYLCEWVAITCYVDDHVNHLQVVNDSLFPAWNEEFHLLCCHNTTTIRYRVLIKYFDFFPRIFKILAVICRSENGRQPIGVTVQLRSLARMSWSTKCRG